MSDTDNNKQVKIVSWNCRSYKKNKEVLIRYAVSNDIDIICLQETKAQHVFKFPGYTVHYTKCMGTPKLGLAVLVKQCFLSVPVECRKHRTETDSLSVAITLKHKVITVTNIYHKYNPTDHTPPSLSTLLRIAPTNHIIIGDLNLHHPVWRYQQTD